MSGIETEQRNRVCSISKDQRRKFLKDLSKHLCMHSVKDRSGNKLITGKYFIRSAIEMVLGQPIMAAQSPEIGSKVSFGRRGASTGVGRCYVCQCETRKQRKTRKACAICLKPVCDEHSIQSATCFSCKETP